MGTEAEKLKAKTQKNFGFEWKKWKKLNEYAEGHFFEVMGAGKEFFAGKTGWDVACGMGRDLEKAVQAVGPRGFMIASDISYAVDQAYDRCSKLGNVLIVQADMYSGFVRKECIDFGYMIGLIQHLTDPKGGIDAVYSRIKKGGYFVGTVYNKPTDNLLKMVNAAIMFMRIFTLHLPLPVVVLISRLFAVPSYLFFKLPNFLLKRTKYVQGMNELYPTHKTQKGEPDFDVLTINWFDHFTAPIIGFYSDEEIMGLLKDTKLEPFEMKYGIFRGTKAG